MVTMETGYMPVFVFLVIAVAFVLVGYLVATLVRPHRPSTVKATTYECGERPIGEAWVRIDVHYYIVALLFAIFDVEAIFLFPWAKALVQAAKPAAQRLATVVVSAPFAFWEGLVFIGILVVGWAYAWRKGALEWVS